MTGRSKVFIGLRLLLVPVVAMGLCGFSGESGRDRRIQNRIYDHLDRAELALDKGRSEEATACAEMVLLKRDITIFVDDRNVPWQIKDSAEKALRSATVNWEDALNREIKFRFVPRAYADVIITYSGGMKHRGREAAGTVQWSRQVMSLGSDSYRYKVTASINLRTHAPNGAMMSQRQMTHTAGHELGHILGLEDTGKQGELMGPLRLDRPVERASAKEVQSLWAIRQRADLILQRITGEGLIAQVPTDEPGVPAQSAPAKQVQALPVPTKKTKELTVPAEPVQKPVTATKPVQPLPVPTKQVQVLSSSAKQFESQETHLRVVGDRGRTAPVRRSRRNRKAPARKKKFSVTGMAR